MSIFKIDSTNIKTEEDLNDFRHMLTKITVEAALNTELDEYLGFAKHEPSKSAMMKHMDIDAPFFFALFE